jgi:signal transduction histidine kinase
MPSHEIIGSSGRAVSMTRDGRTGETCGDEVRGPDEGRDAIADAAVHVHVHVDGGGGLIELLPGARGRDALLRVVELEARVRTLEAQLGAQVGLLATMAHDLRGPLGSVMMAASALAPGPAADPDDPRARRVRVTAERIQRSARRMARLISDLVDLDRFQTGHLRVVVAAAAPRALIDEALEVARSCRARPFTIDVALAPGVPRVRCDRARAVQVLSTLIDHALRVSPDGRPAVIAAAVRGGEVEIAVTDAGPGIPDDERARAFDRDWRSAIPAYRGAGPGLALVKGLVEAQGGHVRVEAPAGGGARFVVALPIDPDAGAAERCAPGCVR